MTAAAEVLEVLAKSAAGLTDAELAVLLGKRHQQVNYTCRLLASQGADTWDSSSGFITNRLTSQSAGPAPASPTPRPSPSPEHGWAWEGNVQASIIAYLTRTGWRIIPVADTARREPGIDLVAEEGGRRLLLEVKGWLGTTYARGERAGQPKPTPPTLQVTHWFAEGPAALMRRGNSPDAALALVLPDKPWYGTLLAQVGWAIERLEFTIFLLTEDGFMLPWQKEN